MFQAKIMPWKQKTGLTQNSHLDLQYGSVFHERKKFCTPACLYCECYCSMLLPLFINSFFNEIFFEEIQWILPVLLPGQLAPCTLAQQPVYFHQSEWSGIAFLQVLDHQLPHTCNRSHLHSETEMKLKLIKQDINRQYFYMEEYSIPFQESPQKLNCSLISTSKLQLSLKWEKAII